MAIPEQLKPSLYGLIHQVESVEVLNNLPIETIYKICNHKGFVAAVFYDFNQLILQDMKKEDGYTFFNKDFYPRFTEPEVETDNYIWGTTIAEIQLAQELELGEVAYITYTSRENPAVTHVLLLVAV